MSALSPEKLQAARLSYLQDTQKISQKPRFGYFSIPPNCSAGDSMFEQKTRNVDQNKRVKTQERNIYSGITSSGMLKKSFFSYLPSVFQGDQFKDPGKVQQQAILQQSKKYNDKQVFRLATHKSPVSASYEYIPHKTHQGTKPRRGQDGNVLTQPPNASSSTQFRIQKQRLKQFKYAVDPYDNAKVIRRKQMMQDISKRGQAPFRAGNPMKDYFNSNKQRFGTDRLIQQKNNVIENKIESDQPFKPSCRSERDTFSYPQYKPNGCVAKKEAPLSQDHRQPFKLLKRGGGMKPSPSVSCLKMNLMRYIR